MNLQYISDHKGKISGVFIPIKEWNTIKEQLHLPDEPKPSHTQDLLEAFEQMKMMKQGKIAKPKLNDFLNELREL
jgi:hypothetical protein